MFKLFQKKKTDPKAQLQAVLGTFELPTFPAIAREVMEKIRDPNVSSSVVAELLARDPGLSSGILRTVNSAAFSPRKRVDNLQQAVAMLGLSQLESIVLSTAVRRILPGAPSPLFSPKRFWQCSATRAAVARTLASELHPATVGLSYMAALLQDMAIPFLVDHGPAVYAEVLEEWRESDTSLVELERAAMGWDHAEVATWICSEWKFPENLAAAIGGHHGTPIEGWEVPPAVLLVSFIEERNMAHGPEAVKDAAHHRYGLDFDRVAPLLEAGLKAAEDLAALFTSGMKEKG